MFHVTLILDSDDILLKVIDKNFNDFFVHQFNPNPTIEWFSGDLKIKSESLKNIEFRNMTFDVRTDLDGVKKLLNFNSNGFNLYQFNKPITGSLLLETLKEASRNNILKQNGLQHIYSMSYEFLTISSFDEVFIETIRRIYSDLILSQKHL